MAATALLGGNIAAADAAPIPLHTFTNAALQRQGVSPTLECVRENGDADYTAFFGYNNRSEDIVMLPIGARNKFSPGPQDRRQPTTFLPGRQIAAFSVDFNGSSLVWALDRSTSTASENSARCAALPIPTPATEVPATIDLGDPVPTETAAEEPTSIPAENPIDPPHRVPKRWTPSRRLRLQRPNRRS